MCVGKKLDKALLIKSLGKFPRIPQGSALSGELAGSFETMTTLFSDGNRLKCPLLGTNIYLYHLNPCFFQTFTPNNGIKCS